MSERPNRKFGCNPRKPGFKAPLRMAKYLSAMPTAPASLSRTGVITDFGMYFNDQIGDCTMAAIAHMLMLITKFTGTPVVPDPSDIRKIYFELTGGQDTGLDLPTVLSYWRDTGIAGHKILQFGDIDPQDMERQRQAMYAFGAVDQAAFMPDSAMDQFDSGKNWTLTGEQGTDGHSFPSFDYEADGDIVNVTWAKTQLMNPGWAETYLFESCAVVAPEWVANADGLAPGFPIDTLIADLKQMGSWKNL